MEADEQLEKLVMVVGVGLAVERAGSAAGNAILAATKRLNRGSPIADEGCCKWRHTWTRMERVKQFSCSLQSEFENMSLSQADPFEIALRHVASLVKETHPRLFNQVNNFGFDLCVFYFVAFSLILNL